MSVVDGIEYIPSDMITEGNYIQPQATDIKPKHEHTRP